MRSVISPLIDILDTLLAWLGSSLKQTTKSYVDLETANDKTTLVASDGSLVTIIRLHGVMELIGNEEFVRIHGGLNQSLRTAMLRPGHAVQFFFNYDKEAVKELIEEIFTPARQTAQRLKLGLQDLFEERRDYLAQYCAQESVFMVLWTRPSALTKEQNKRVFKQKRKDIRDQKLPPFSNAQNIVAGIPDIRDTHDSFVRATYNDLKANNIYADVLGVHEALHQVRMSVDPEFTDRTWTPVLPGDKIPMRAFEQEKPDISEILWPPLAQQLIPRDAVMEDLRTVRIGDRIYTTLFIELFPKDIRAFIQLFRRTLPTQIPWRMSFFIESDGLKALSLKKNLSAILSWTSSQNRLINDSIKLLEEISVNTDDAIVKLRVAATTWAPEGNIPLLRTRTSQLAKAIEGWGTCEVSEMSGDPFGATVSSMLAISASSLAPPSAAPLSEVVVLLPFTRPASPWENGAILFRTPEGKPWPYQPGSAMQVSWIDLFYARPGSGKSVLSNAMNLALCLSGGIKRLPRIAIIDIGPSSSGLISLLQEALPLDQKHQVAYHRLQMNPENSINPFDTQLGCRYPTPLERAFLVNFVTLLATPVGEIKPYDGVPDMVGMVVDELYKMTSDEGKPTVYTVGMEPFIDAILEEIGVVTDAHTTWWEVTDALFGAGFYHEASMAQRFAMPLVADIVSICRTPAIEDLYGQIVAPTGEPLIKAFSRMISSSVREYPILSRPTKFDLGDARIVSLDLDEVAKTGGDAADRQTAVMYMLARYVLAKNYYLTDQTVAAMPEQYQGYHKDRIAEIREDPKRIVYDEFHRTGSAQAVRDQVVVDMREGRKWNVQVALLSQSVEDFDAVMIEFATSIYIMDAGPEQAIARTAEIFGLSDTAVLALRTRVHGPREGGSTFLAQFATKMGMNTQLLTCTLGPIELWSFSTTAEDANLRNKLYQRIGPSEARRVLATLFPSGSIKSLVEKRMSEIREEEGHIADASQVGLIDQIAEEIIEAYSETPDLKSLPRNVMQSLGLA